jgi:hypothetical protein
MKDYIYTVWPKPWDIDKRIFNIISIIASTEFSKKIGKSVKIYTTTEEAKFLKTVTSDIEFVCSLDPLESLNVTKWAFPKMFVLNSITTPVVHIDYDVFLFKPQKSYNCDIVTQNLEITFGYYNIYKSVFEDCFSDIELSNLKDEMQAIYKNSLYAGYNCGYIDVCNVEACKLWTNKSIELFNNIKNFKNVFANILPEQNLLYAFSCMNKIHVETLLDSKKDSIQQNEEAHTLGYCHLMSTKTHVINDKNVTNMDFLNKILNYIEINFSNAYEKICNISDNNFKQYLEFYNNKTDVYINKNN